MFMWCSCVDKGLLICPSGINKLGLVSLDTVCVDSEYLSMNQKRLKLNLYTLFLKYLYNNALRINSYTAFVSKLTNCTYE